MVYDLTRLTNGEVKRAVRTSRLRSIGGSGTCQCFHLLTGQVGDSEGLGQGRRSGMVASEQYTDSPLLGRTTNQTDVLRRQSSHIVTGQDLRLLTLSHVERVLSSDGTTNPISIFTRTASNSDSEARDISVVVRVVKNNSLCNILAVKLRGLSAMRAVNYLNYSFDAGFEEIEINGVKSSPTALMGDLPGLQTVPACEVAPLSFWGGPPNKCTWYDGSLLTLLIDRVMRAADAGNMSLLSRFLNLTL